MQKAALEMGTPGGFHGYIPSEQGYPFLREAIARYYAKHGVVLSIDEIFISDGAKSDLGNLLDLFAQDNTVLYPRSGLSRLCRRQRYGGPEDRLLRRECRKWLSAAAGRECTGRSNLHLLAQQPHRRGLRPCGA